MIQKVKILTVAKQHWIKSEIPYIVSQLNKSKGRSVVEVDIETIKNLKPLTFVDNDGDRRISWDWFKQNISDRVDPYYNVICLHISPLHKKRWKLSKDIGGSYRNDPDPKIEFWICGTAKEALGYTISDFQRKFFHEMAHGDSHFAGVPKNWRGLQREFVHTQDYVAKDIHNTPELIDYSMYNTQSKLVELLTKIISWRA